MSVQVRRRREAAAFLASFVGAGGELIVDTTNNRVQVHDGITPGGFAAASIRDTAGFNLGINTNGAINQRGVSGTVTLAAGAYGHDRMKGGASGCTYTFSTSANGDTTFTITAGSLIQAIDTPNVFATAMWLTWTGTAPARVYQGAVGSAPALAAGVSISIDGTTVNALLQSGLALGIVTLVEFGTGTLGTTRPWQLEAALPNAGPSRLARRHGELPLCLRYFNRLGNTNSTYYKFGIGAAVSSSYFVFQIPLVVPMRATPTVTSTGNFVLTGTNQVSATAPFGIDGGDGRIITLNASLSNLSGFYTVQGYSDATAAINLSAEL